MDDATAEAWAAVGLVDIVRDEPPHDPPTPSPKLKADPKPKASKTKRR